MENPTDKPPYDFSDYEEYVPHEDSKIPPKSCSCCPTSSPKWEIGPNLSVILFVVALMLGMALFVFVSGKFPH